MHSFVVGPEAFDIVVVEGKDAERFLQGQLTCDVAAIADNHWALGSCCNNKGRVLATFVLVRRADSFRLCMTHGTGELLLAALKKFLPFYKCTMQLLADSHCLYGLAGSAAEQQRAHLQGQPEGTSLLLPADGSGNWLCWLGGRTPRALLWASATDTAIPSPSASLDQWEALGLLQGQYPFHAQDSGEYTPQELQLDQNGYVSFTKGCYTGQEIVARLHYRGKPKKQLFLLQLTARPLDQHREVTDADGQVVGSLLLCRPLGGTWLALVQLPAGYASPFGQLRCDVATATAGCAFEATVIQLSSLIFP